MDLMLELFEAIEAAIRELEAANAPPLAGPDNPPCLATGTPVVDEIQQNEEVSVDRN